MASMTLRFILAPLALASAVYAASKPSTVAASWYAGWHASEGFPLSNVSWDKYTHMTFSFACVVLALRYPVPLTSVT